jgi:hypothetical protein
MSDFLCQDRSHDPSLFISHTNFSSSMDHEFYKVHISFGFITWDVGRGGTWANMISGKGLEIGKDWNLSNFKLLYRIR